MMVVYFFFNDTATTEIYTLSLHDALPILVLGHRGALWLAVRTAGRAAHGSTPERGHNAVLDLVSVLGRAGDALPLRTDPFLGTETWNPGVVAGGSVPNIVPDRAEAVVDMRTVGDGGDLLRWWRDQP